MKSADLLKQYLNRNSKPRVIGRINASEVHYIRKGWKTPEQWIANEPIEENIDGILNGMMKEDYLAMILNEMGVKCKCGENQPKYELKISDDVVIVCKPDFEFTEVVWETKAPIFYRDFDKVKDSYKDQLEIEHRATGKQIMLGYFKEGQVFPVLIPYKPSDRRWKNIQEKILAFDKLVRGGKVEDKQSGIDYEVGEIKLEDMPLNL